MNALPKHKLVLGIKEAVNGHPELYVGDLLTLTGTIRIIASEDGKVYVLKRTPKGGLQLCAEASGPALKIA